MPEPTVTEYYQWKEFATVEGEDKPRLLTPWADPNEHETAFDFGFETIEAAVIGLVQWGAYHEAKEANWVLVKVVESPEMRVSDIDDIMMEIARQQA